MGNSKNKKILILGILLVVLLGASFVVYTIASANDADNNIRVKTATMTYIKTGNGSFANDGLSYPNSNSASYSAISGYTAGNDSNANNRIVRSFDTLTYGFDFVLTPKNGVSQEDNRKIKVTVTLTEDEAKYVACNKNDKAGATTCEYIFENIDTESTYEEEVVLYVLGAPNETLIQPKFNIKESTDSEEGVYLGKISNDLYYYSYQDNSYDSTCSFNNYLPTIVSSKEGTVSLNLVRSSSEYQSATYNGQVGRFITFIAGIKLNANANTGIKGLTMPTGDITFDAKFTQNGSNKIIFDSKWIRLYGQNKIESLDPLVVNLPYSTTDSNNRVKQINYPGKVSSTSKSDDTYTIKVSDYAPTYYYPTIGADNNKLSSLDDYISTVALTVFSPRTKQDGKNDITVNIATSNGIAKSTTGATIGIGNTSSDAVNKYYENSDYSVSAAFYDSNGSKISGTNKLGNITMKNGVGAVSKGTNFTYKTVFNYNKTLSDLGFKEVIKIDDNAFRFMPYEDLKGRKDYKISLNCGGTKCGITEDDFEVKFVSGSWDASNYSIADVSGINFGEDEDKNMAVTQCSNLTLGSYNVNQIQNLYGGPCITANEGIEEQFEKISDAKKDDKEIHLTKAIVQTKEGVKLPDNITITVELNIRVRNVSDLTQTYQGTVVVSTSDYDKETYYYAPSITNDINSVCNQDNYKKTVYQGRTIIDGDDSIFGDSLRIVNFTSREELTVKNKNADGSTKTNYDVSNNETITYNIKTIIEDNNEAVGADDVWYINSLIVSARIPKELEYIADADLRKPESVVPQADGSVILYYRLPYTKPNMKIPEIDFKARIKPTLSGSSSAIPITVESSVYAENINGETDNSVVGALSSNFTIYATGLNSVIVQQEVGKSGTLVEKNDVINYVLKAYNNTGSDVEDYGIIDILPYDKDANDSHVSGKYSTKVELPDSLAGARVLCSTQNPIDIVKEVNNTKNEWHDCEVTEEYVEGVTAIKIQDISIRRASYMGDVKISLKPTGNSYSDSYNNSFLGETNEHAKNNSNVIKVKVVSRKISGKVFLDITGDGVKDGNEKYLSGIPATLYKINDDNTVEEVAQTTTDSNGYYEFKDLDKGRFKIALIYDADKYDLTLRYATEDTSKDSDAYKIDDNGTAEISNKKVPDDPNGIRLTRDITLAEDMDMGLIPRQGLGFSMSKYITKIDLSYNGSVNTTNYNNQSSVTITVRNSLNASAKVYYGISITNTSYKSGYINLVQEDIPTGMVFDASDPYNSQWFEAGGVIHSNSLEDQIIAPGETKYLQIALLMPQREEAGTFLNTASVLESKMYDPDALADDETGSMHDDYKVGDSLTFAGVKWHVINVVNNLSREQAINDLGYAELDELTEDQENEINNYLNRNQILTLLADSKTIAELKSHTSSASSTYKWSESNINGYLNSNWENTNRLNLPILFDQTVCDDASGLQKASYGGSMLSEGTCISGIYATSKVRLLTLKEYTNLMNSGLSDLSWLNGEKDYWLQSSDYISPEYLQPYINAYNNSIAKKDGSAVYNNVNYGIQQNSVHNKAMYIDHTNRINKSDNASNTKEVRPVITISTHNIVLE